MHRPTAVHTVKDTTLINMGVNVEEGDEMYNMVQIS